MNKTLLILAHDNFENSVFNKKLVESLDKNKIDVHVIKDISSINIEEEQKLITKYDKIIFQFPLYWFNVPANLKYWLDKVLTMGFAYGETYALENKEIYAVVTTGSPLEKYTVDQYGTIRELTKNLENTASFIKAKYKGVIMEVYNCKPENFGGMPLYMLEKKAEEYKQIINNL